MPLECRHFYLVEQAYTMCCAVSFCSDDKFASATWVSEWQRKKGKTERYKGRDKTLSSSGYSYGHAAWAGSGLCQSHHQGLPLEWQWSDCWDHLPFPQVLEQRTGSEVQQPGFRVGLWHQMQMWQSEPQLLPEIFEVLKDLRNIGLLKHSGTEAFNENMAC